MTDFRVIEGDGPEPQNDLAAWLRSYADRAEAGEIVAFAVAFVTNRRAVKTAWHDEAGCGLELVSGTALLAHRVAAVTDAALSIFEPNQK